MRGRGQTRKSSLAEAVVNVLVGFFVSMLSNFVIFAIYGLQITMRAQLAVTVWFTLISIARSYMLRRVFNLVLERKMRRQL